MKPSEVKTKNQFREYSKFHGVTVRYSGHLRKFFITKWYKMDINAIINAK